MAGIFGRALGNGYRMPPPYSEIEDEQADALAQVAARNGTPLPSYMTPGGGFGGGLPNATPPAGMFGGAVAAATKPKFFGEGGAGRGIAGSIGDFLLQRSGAQPIYAPAVQEQRKDARETARQELMMKRFEATQNRPSNFLRSFQDYMSLPLEQRAIADKFRRDGAPRIISDAAGNQYVMPDEEQPPAPSASGQDVPTVASEQDYHALPSGAQFRDPQGNLRTKR